MVTKFRRVLKTTDAVAPEDGVFEVRVTSMGRVNAFVEDVVSHLVGSEKYAPSKEIRIMARGKQVFANVFTLLQGLPFPRLWSSRRSWAVEYLHFHKRSLCLAGKSWVSRSQVELGSSDVEDVFEPVGEHDDDTGNVTRVRIVPSLVITLKAIEEIKPEDIKEHHFIKYVESLPQRVTAFLDVQCWSTRRGIVPLGDLIPVRRDGINHRRLLSQRQWRQQLLVRWWILRMFWVELCVDSTTEDDSGVKKEKRRDRRRRNYRGRIEQGRGHCDVCVVGFKFVVG